MWKTICGAKGYVEDDRVLRGIQNGETVYPYRYDKAGGWKLATGVREATFRAGYAREMYIWHT